MLITASGYIRPGFLLLTLGHTCRYGIVGSSAGEGFSGSGLSSLVLIDPGSSAHLAPLEERLSGFGFSLAQVSYVLLTHLDAERCAIIPYLRERNPRLTVIGSGHMQQRLREADEQARLYEADCAWRKTCAHLASSSPLTLSEFSSGLTIDLCVGESEVLELTDGISVRVISAPGHTPFSLAYHVEPCHFLIADEVIGYYRGRALTSPGGDSCIHTSRTTLEKLSRLELNGLCFPHRGVLVGDLVRKHLHDLIQNTDDLVREYDKAISLGVDSRHIWESIRESFYTLESSDPFLVSSLARSGRAIWTQLQSRPQSPTTN